MSSKSGSHPAAEGKPNDEELIMTHAIMGTSGELVGVLLVSRNLAYLSRMQSTLAYSRKLVALGRLTAGIAHEVKNPLNAMMIHLELLRTKIRGAAVALQQEAVGAASGSSGMLGLGPGRTAALPAPVQGALEHVSIIESEIRRLDEVVQGFLKFTRPEDLRLQPVRVNTLLDEILPIIEPEATKNNVKVTVDVPSTLPAVNGDSAMLRQAFLNLAINACQAMPSGGTLRLTSSPMSRSRVEVRVQDTGVGIAPEHLSKIFDLYFTTKERGTGIGLSMVYRIIQMHDGEVEVQSTPGAGRRSASCCHARAGFEHAHEVSPLVSDPTLRISHAHEVRPSPIEHGPALGIEHCAVRSVGGRRRRLRQGPRANRARRAAAGDAATPVARVRAA